jgi:hypothetical protein
MKERQGHSKCDCCNARQQLECDDEVAKERVGYIADTIHFGLGQRAST